MEAVVNRYGKKYENLNVSIIDDDFEPEMCSRIRQYSIGSNGGSLSLLQLDNFSVVSEISPDKSKIISRRIMNYSTRSRYNDSTIQINCETLIR